MACMATHGMAAGEAGMMPVMPGHAHGAAQVAPTASHGRMMANETGAGGTCSEQQAAHPRTSTDDEAPVPSHCPDFGMPASCATMVACSAVAVSPVTSLLLATEGLQMGERLVEPVTRPLSLAPAPDVPPPRA